MKKPIYLTKNIHIPTFIPNLDTINVSSYRLRHPWHIYWFTFIVGVLTIF